MMPETEAPEGSSNGSQAPSRPSLTGDRSATKATLGAVSMAQKSADKNDAFEIQLESPSPSSAAVAELKWFNLTYSIEHREWRFKKLRPRRLRTSKTILSGLSGSCRAGRVTAILGPSGSGKSTLLECLFGKRKRGLTGTISYTGMNGLRAAFISQSDFLIEHLTTRETLLFASRIKCSKVLPVTVPGQQEPADEGLMPIKTKRGKVSAAQAAHLARVSAILKELWLTPCADVRLEKCSGGQRKRVSIACELISRPQIIILDEPTSGLDSSTCLQCIQILRNLADTSGGSLAILLSIHQPSARIFAQFDEVYILSKDGQAAFVGPPGELVNFLSICGVVCPKFHNPSDLAIELASGELSEETLQLAIKTAELDVPSSRKPSTQLVFTAPKPMHKKSTFLTHFSTLLWRNFTMIMRDPVLTSMRFATHIGVAVVVSLMYGQDVGVASGCNAFTTYGAPYPVDSGRLVSTNENVTFVLFTLMFLSFTAMMPTVLTFPRELSVFRKEYDNGWYSVGVYYLARLVVDLPFQFLFPLLYAAIAFPMTGQLETGDRLVLFALVCCLVSLVSQSIGVLIGTIFPESLNMVVFLAPISTIPAFLFSGFFVRLSSMPSYLRPFAYLSYVKYAFECFVITIYGLNRCNGFNPYRQALERGLPLSRFVSPLNMSSDGNGVGDGIAEDDASFGVHKAYQYYGFKPKTFSYVMVEYDVEEKSLSEGCLILVAICVVLRFVSLLYLWRQARSTT